MNQRRITRQQWFDAVYILLMGVLALVGLYYDPFPGKGCEQPTERAERVEENSTN